MTWRFSSDRADLALGARDEFLNAVHDVNKDVDNFTARLIFTELVANVIRHAPGPIDISFDAADGSLWLHVTDSGPPFDWKPLIPAAHAEGGRGLFLVSQCAADVSLERTQEGNIMHVKLNQSTGFGAAMERRNDVSLEDEHVLQAKCEEHSRQA